MTRCHSLLITRVCADRANTRRYCTLSRSKQIDDISHTFHMFPASKEAVLALLSGINNLDVSNYHNVISGVKIHLGGEGD